MDFLTQYKEARRVSTPLVCIHTFDARSTIDQIRGSLGDKLSENPLILWDAMHGMRGLTEQGTNELGAMLNGNEPDASIPLPSTLAMAERASKYVTIFIANAHLHWVNEPTVIQGIWNLRDEFKANGSMLILLCAPGAVLPAELTNDVLVMDEPLPTVPEIQASIKDTFKFAKIDPPTEDVLAKATDALIGVPAFAAEQSTAMCLHTKKVGDKRTGTLDITALWRHKREVIRQTPGLSVWEGKESLADVGGLTQIKKFYESLMNGNQPPKVIIFIDEIEKAFAGTGTELSGVTTQMTGAMLSWMQDRKVAGSISIGLPGVSKSHLVKALGGTYGVPVINFDIAGMQSGIIGSSGANLRTAQKTVDAISGGDGNVLALATCNSIHALPPELRRRFNLGIFFFDAPTAQEREAIWNIHRAKYSIPVTERNPNSEGWTGAEIEECCSKAYRLKTTLADAASYIVPVTKSSADLVGNLRNACSGKYLSASKPGVYLSSETTTSASAQTVASAPRGRVLRDTEE